MTTTGGMSEGDWEQLALDTLADLAWTPLHGTKIAPGSGERERWEDLHIPSRTLAAMRKFNPEVPAEYLLQALAAITSPTSIDAITENYRMHAILWTGSGGSATSTVRGRSGRPPSGSSAPTPTRTTGWRSTR